MGMVEKRSNGRQRIEIKKLNDKAVKQVTFSKRRSGLFKKAAELSVLCGCHVAAFAFSPNGKLFCFGHPSADSVLAAFLDGTPPPPPSPNDGEEREIKRTSGGVAPPPPEIAAPPPTEEPGDQLAALVELRAKLVAKLEEVRTSW